MSQTPLDRALTRAAARVRRLTPAAAMDASRDGAVIVDVRVSEDRERDGVVPGSVHIPRTVLEWRLDPGGAWRTPHIGVAERLVVVCTDGCSSLLAAASLLDLGLDAADVVGGIRAWSAAGLPLASATDPPTGVLPGAGPPEPS